MKYTIQRVSDLSATNRRRVVRVLMESDEVSRREIAQRTGLAPSTVSMITGELIESGAIYTAGKRSQISAGRREEVVARHPGAATAISVHYPGFRSLD